MDENDTLKMQITDKHCRNCKQENLPTNLVAKRDLLVPQRKSVICKPCANAKAKAWRAANHDYYIETQRTYYDAHKDEPGYLEKYAQANLRAYNRLKDEIFNLLGGCCQRCGHKDWGVLQIDHVNSNGRAHRETSRSPSKYYREMRDFLRITNPQNEYQLLCANCHHRKSKVEQGGTKKYLL